MHERSLARALLNQIESYKAPHPGSRVAVIRLSIGRFSGVEPDLFQWALEELVQESPYRGASIETTIVEIEARCPECRHQFAVKSFSFTCPTCGCQRTQVIRGEELVLESLVLEEIPLCPTRS